MGTLCSRHWDLLEEEREKDHNIGRGQPWAVWLVPPLVLFDDNGSAGLDEVVVCEHKEVGEGRGACPCTHCGGDEVLQRGVEGEGGEQVLLLHFEASCEGGREGGVRER